MKRTVIPYVIVLLFLTSCSVTLQGPKAPALETYMLIPPMKSTMLCNGRHFVIDADIEWHTKDNKETDSYLKLPFIYRPRNTGNKKNDTLRGELLYRKGNFIVRDLVVLIPGTGENISTAGSAEALAEHGYDSVRFRSGIEIFDESLLNGKLALDEDEMRGFIRIGKERIRDRACDYVLAIHHLTQKLHYQRIGISGVSLGGIFAPIVAHQYPYITSTLIMISGGGVADILRHSTEKRIITTRNRLQELFIGSEKRLWEIMREELWEIDPLRFANNTNPNRMRVIANYWDQAVPFTAAVKLRNASNRPPLEIVLFPPGHYGSVLMLWVPIVRWIPLGECPLCIYYPTYGRVQDLNVDFFTQTLPRP